MFKKTKLTAFRDVISPVTSLSKNEWYMVCDELANPRRTLRAYQNEDGSVFAISCELPHRARFNLQQLFKNVEKNKIFLHTINGDERALGQFLIERTIYEFPRLLDAEVINITLANKQESYRCGYSILLGKKEISVKRYEVGAY